MFGANKTRAGRNWQPYFWEKESIITKLIFDALFG
jgi:hypothetical protein